MPSARLRCALTYTFFQIGRAAEHVRTEIGRQRCPPSRPVDAVRRTWRSQAERCDRMSSTRSNPKRSPGGYWSMPRPIQAVSYPLSANTPGDVCSMYHMNAILVPHQSMGRRELAWQNRSARRNAAWTVGIRAGEPSTGSGNSVHVWRYEYGMIGRSMALAGVKRVLPVTSSSRCAGRSAGPVRAI